jgi:hypothetical protein
MKRLILLLIAPLYLFCHPIQTLYHPNGYLASSGNTNLPFYHDNGQMVGFGVGHSDPRIFYKNGQVAWYGYFSKECTFTYSSCTIFHANAQRAWKGAAYRDSLFSSDPCTVFHSNGEIAWKGALNKDCSYSYGDCTLYHRNRQVAWKGATRQESTYSNDPCTIFHSNGRPAWRGFFAYETSSLYDSGIYHDNGVLAWSGRLGDPTYDRNGYIYVANAEAMNMPIGEDSWLYIAHNGVRYLHLSIGEQSFLTFSNLDQNPRLLMSLGQGFNLECFPYTGNMPQITAYGIPIPVREK